MRHTLITIAAWTVAIAVVLWQRLLRPSLEAAFPGLFDPLSPGASSESNPCLTAVPAARPTRAVRSPRSSRSSQTARAAAHLA